MKKPPPDQAPLPERVRHVLADMDPEDLGPGAVAYDVAAGLLLLRLHAPKPLSVEDVHHVWVRVFGEYAWLLQTPQRMYLTRLTRRLQQLQHSPPGEVARLGPGSTGRWLVRSRGTVHVLDLDAGTYERRPGPTSQTFAYDNQPVPLTRIEIWPEVGGRMFVWFDDPGLPEALEHYRVCSRIRSITRDTPDAALDETRA